MVARKRGEVTFSPRKNHVSIFLALQCDKKVELLYFFYVYWRYFAVW